MNRLHATIRATSLILLAATFGCGGSEPKGKVTGTVTYNDKPVPGGTVVFLSPDNTKVERVPIQANGEYVSTNVPLGDVRVAVEPAPKSAMSYMPKGVKKPDISPDSPAAKNYAQSGSDYVDIPKAFRNPETSNLTLKVAPGDQTYDIPLKGPAK